MVKLENFLRVTFKITVEQKNKNKFISTTYVAPLRSHNVIVKAANNYNLLEMKISYFKIYWYAFRNHANYIDKHVKEILLCTLELRLEVIWARSRFFSSNFKIFQKPNINIQIEFNFCLTSFDLKSLLIVDNCRFWYDCFNFSGTTTSTLKYFTKIKLIQRLITFWLVFCVLFVL